MSPKNHLVFLLPFQAPKHQQADRQRVHPTHSEANPSNSLRTVESLRHSLKRSLVRFSHTR